MRDIFEAAEKQSATLALFVEHLAKRRGFGARTVPGMLVRPDERGGEPRLLMLYSADVLLPFGRAVTFVPASAPRVGGDTWMVDVRRSDGVSRPEWNQGIAIAKVKGQYELTYDGGVLDASRLGALLDAVAQP